MDSTTYSSFLEQSLDVKAELSATFEAAKLGGNWQNNWKASEAFKSGVKVTNDSLDYQGGTPSPSMFDTWYQSVQNFRPRSPSRSNPSMSYCNQRYLTM
jgi:hypothetical protein